MSHLFKPGQRVRRVHSTSPGWVGRWTLPMVRGGEYVVLGYSDLTDGHSVCFEGLVNVGGSAVYFTDNFFEPVEDWDDAAN